MRHNVKAFPTEDSVEARWAHHLGFWEKGAKLEGRVQSVRGDRQQWVPHITHMAQATSFHECQLEQVPGTLQQWSSRAKQEVGVVVSRRLSRRPLTPTQALCKPGNLLSLNPSPPEGRGIRLAPRFSNLRVPGTRGDGSAC